jgi:phosphate:Na+ symporter
MILQSSSATTVMLIGFASAGIISLTQSMAVILGADLGTTFTVQLLAFKFSDYALILITVGFTLTFIAKSKLYKHIGTIIMGFGFIFFGMKLMSLATSTLRDVSHFQDVMVFFEKNEVTSLIVAMVFTGIIQSSAATIGLLMSLSLSHDITLKIAVPMILGANIGTCTAALIAGLSSNTEGKRVAVAHIAIKVMGAMALLPFITPFISIVELTASDLTRQIANSHLLFNVAVAFVFFPFTGLGAKLLCLILPHDKTLQKAFEPRYLDKRALETPSLACGYASREIMRMADIVRGMIADSLRVFEKNDVELIEDIHARDDHVDILNREVKFYLAKISQNQMDENMTTRALSLVTISSDLEQIGDIIGKNILELAEKKIEKKRIFSREGFAEIQTFYEEVLKNFDMAIIVFSTRDENLARKILRNKVKIKGLLSEFKLHHFERLQQGFKESIATSSIHLELLINLTGINSFFSKIAHEVLSDKPAKASEE